VVPAVQAAGWQLQHPQYHLQPLHHCTAHDPCWSSHAGWPAAASASACCL
jgi:hypothetical protein